MRRLLLAFSWPELRHHPWRNAAAVVAVMLGVALAFAEQTINASALDEFSSAVRSVNGQPDLELRAVQGSFDEALYQRVLDDVLTQWLAGMEDLSHSDDPQQALRRYIRAKLHYSRTRPQGAKVFTKEVIAGAPRYGTAITERVAPLLKTEVRTFERWAREGRIAKVNFTHLMFIIWSVTQAYAEQEAQFALLLGKRIQLIGSTLRSRDADYKARLIAELGQKVWPLFESGQLSPQLERTFPIRDAQSAFDTLASNQVQGKVVVLIDESLS